MVQAPLQVPPSAAVRRAGKSLCCRGKQVHSKKLSANHMPATQSVVKGLQAGLGLTWAIVARKWLGSERLCLTSRALSVMKPSPQLLQKTGHTVVRSQNASGSIACVWLRLDAAGVYTGACRLCLQKQASVQVGANCLPAVRQVPDCAAGDVAVMHANNPRRQIQHTTCDFALPLGPTQCPCPSTGEYPHGFVVAPRCVRMGIAVLSQAIDHYWDMRVLLPDASGCHPKGLYDGRTARRPLDLLDTGICPLILPVTCTLPLAVPAATADSNNLLRRSGGALLQQRNC